MTSQSLRRRGAHAGIAALATALLAATALPASATATRPAGPSINGYRAVGYVMADSPVTRDFQIADLVATGAADDLTHLNYAFGNVTDDLICEITQVPGEGDAENDFLREVSAADSVDGVGDAPGQRLAGNFNQLRKLKAANPDLSVLVSLGGWTWSDNFSEAAATPESRARLVDSCVDLYIHGNLPTIDGRGGDGAAAGLFDGIDIDWEWPVTGGETANASPQDKENFLALMEEFRDRLAEAGAETGEDYLLTAFAPAGGWNASEGGWLDPRLFATVDYLNVQGYDFHGGWVPNETGHQGNLHPDGEHNWGLALDGAMGMYVRAGADPGQLNAGLAAYGHGWRGVTDGSQGWRPAGGYVGTRTYAELREFGDPYFDDEIGASWRYDGDEWWSYDDPTSVTAKAEWLADQGYGGAMWWDLSGDYENELGLALGTALRAAPRGPLTGQSVTIDPVADQTTTVGTAVELTLTGSAVPAATTTLSATGLPPGIEFDQATGRVAGVPTAEGTHRVTVSAGAHGLVDTAEFSWTVTAAAEPSTTPPSIAGAPGPATVGTPYRHVFVIGGDPTPTARVTEGALPPGLALTPEGVVEGTPTRVGEHAFTVTVENGVGEPRSLDAVLTVTEAGQRTPVLTLDADKVAPGDQITVSGTGFGDGERLSAVMRSAPVELGGVTANADGTFQWTFAVPRDTAEGTHTITLTGPDSGSATASFVVEFVRAVSADAPKPGLLATTGAQIAAAAGVAAVLLATGGLLVMRRNRALGK